MEDDVMLRLRYAGQNTKPAIRGTMRPSRGGRQMDGQAHFERLLLQGHNRGI